MIKILSPDIEQIKNCGVFSHLDISFAQFILRLSDNKPPELFWVTLLLSYVSSSEGHVCLDLEAITSTCLPEELRKAIPSLPPVNKLSDIVTSCSVVGKPGEFCPLILDGQLLYLHKFWQYEIDIAERLDTLASETVETSGSDNLLSLLDKYFPQHKGEINWQRVAACIAATKRLCIITGGPGTGKTTAVVRILALLIEHAQDKKLRIALAAPTGKAAARMDEAVQKAKESLENFKHIEESMPASASTIHRLLGAVHNSHNFRYNRNNPLPIDIAVIDEASMIDLSLMAKLLKALPDRCRLILLGDRDQLASVEAGSVFGDICNTDYISVFSQSFKQSLQSLASGNLPESNVTETAPDLANGIVELKKVYRFRGMLADYSNAVKNGDGKAALSINTTYELKNVCWKDLPSGKHLSDIIKEDIIKGWQAYLEAENIEDMFSAFNRLRFLCVLRSGPFGVYNLNKVIENILAETGMLSPASNWYAKKPIMITKNDYQMNLYNGDTGIIAPALEDEGKLKAWFPPLTTDNKAAYRSFSPSRLPANETAYAITVHKSQGTEFDSIMLLLPDKDTPLLSRELIYTGITRAREKVIIYGKQDIFKTAVERKIDRRSGLREKLWGKLH